MTFADGETHAFTAERADPRTAAGLYESRSSEGQVGLIVTNALEAAGAVRLNPGTDAPTVAAPVSVQQPLTGTTGVNGIAVTIPAIEPVGTVRTLPRIVPSATSITAVSPTLYVLVHGMAHPVDVDPRSADSPEYSRDEWSLEFLQGLLGGREPSGPGQVQLFDFTGQAVNADTYLAPPPAAPAGGGARVRADAGSERWSRPRAARSSGGLRPSTPSGHVERRRDGERAEPLTVRCAPQEWTRVTVRLPVEGLVAP